mgnify:CR=1 FL=1
MMKYIITAALCSVLIFASCTNNRTESKLENEMTAEIAYEGVNNYCHKEYDWSAAKENPSLMYVKADGETATEYKVVFRSYTGAMVFFYVDKASGTTRIVEYEPTLKAECEAGSFNLFDYMKAKE